VADVGTKVYVASDKIEICGMPSGVSRFLRQERDYHFFGPLARARRSGSRPVFLFGASASAAPVSNRRKSCWIVTGKRNETRGGNPVGLQVFGGSPSDPVGWVRGCVSDGGCCEE